MGLDRVGDRLTHNLYLFYLEHVQQSQVHDGEANMGTITAHSSMSQPSSPVDPSPWSADNAAHAPPLVAAPPS